MKKVFLLLLIFPLIQLACEKEDYGSCENKPYFNITGIELNSVGKVQQPNGAGSETVLKDQDAVPFNSF
ncbi:MAG TPA: hypothetical protein VEV15_02905, partial [Flavisolibacter sp.]|nr:hypothetical protein [Flavisolibacter sp.]